VVTALGFSVDVPHVASELSPYQVDTAEARAGGDSHFRDQSPTEKRSISLGLEANQSGLSGTDSDPSGAT
jgi:hypothetical protein